jgi:CDP-diacylglycerol--glycerol-3-phosphate 3-phosphatidyltransferase
MFFYFPKGGVVFLKKYPKQNDDGRFFHVAYWSPADYATATRLLAAPILMVFVLRAFLTNDAIANWNYSVIWLLLIATDAADGALARKFGSSLRGASFDEKADKILIGLTLITLGLVGQIGLYFVIIMLTRDIAVTIIRSHLSQKGVHSLKSAKLSGKTKTVLQCGLIFTALCPSPPALLIFVFSALAAIMSVASGFQILILGLAELDANWLLPLKGRIGAANWLSAVRLAMSLIVPYIYISQPLGHLSNLTATIILALAILTDKLDGIIARKRNEVTKVGKAFDPLGDKFIQYASGVGLLVAASSANLLPLDDNVFILAVFLVILRDAGFVVFWFITRHEVPAGAIDKIRAVAMAICVIAMACTLCLTGTPAIFTSLCAAFALLFTAALSVASIVVDVKRLNQNTRQ